MRRFISIWLVAVVCSSNLGWAGPTDDCNQENDIDRRIRGCTELIMASKDPFVLAPAYGNRGFAHQKKGDHDGAISDFTKAIDIDPKYARIPNGGAAANSTRS